jgi:hypothetical protein
MKYRSVVIWFLLAAALTVSAAGEDREARLAEIVARYREIVEHREVQGGKSLSDVFNWFAKVEANGELGLLMRLMKARTQGVNVYTGEHSWKAIGAGNTVNIRSGEKKCIWAVGISLDIGLDNAIFPVDDCPWLSNSVHTVYVRMRESSEFHNTVKVDSYVISLDQKRAYYREGKREVAYPFPFVNARPDMTQEEWECQRDLPGYLKDIERRIARYVKSCGPIEPNRRYVVKAKGEWSGRPEFDYVMFGDDGQSMTCVEYFPKRGESAAEAVVRDFNRANNQYELCLLKSDGSIVDCDSIVDGKLERNKDGKFGNAFVLRVLARLSLTAADLPGINLEPVLGNGR